MHALDSVEALDDGAAAAVEGSVHDLHIVLRAGQSGQGGTLGDVIDVGGHVRLQVRSRSDNVARTNHPAHAPTGHGVGLGHTVEDYTVIGQLGHSLQNRDRVGAIVGEVFVDLVGQNEDALPQGPLADGAGFLFGVHGTGRVGGGDEDERLGGGGVGFLELLDGDLVVLVATGKNLNGVTAGQTDAFGVGGPIGSRQQNVVALVNDRGEGLVHGLLAAVGHDDLGGIDLNAGVAQGLVRDGLLQLGQAGGGGVAEVLGVLQCFVGGIHNVRGGSKVGFAGAEADDGASLSLECFGLCVNGKGCGGCNGTDTAGNARHGGSLLSYCVLRGRNAGEVVVGGPVGGCAGCVTSYVPRV